MVTYNYNLNWDDDIRESQKELSSLGNTITTHDEAELMENISNKEDDRIKPHNWDTEFLMKISTDPAKLYLSNKYRDWAYSVYRFTYAYKLFTYISAKMILKYLIQ